jgi:hypothetical protein
MRSDPRFIEKLLTDGKHTDEHSRCSGMPSASAVVIAAANDAARRAVTKALTHPGTNFPPGLLVAARNPILNISLQSRLKLIAATRRNPKPSTQLGWGWGVCCLNLD